MVEDLVAKIGPAAEPRGFESFRRAFGPRL
jgi:hypothetical protein